MSDILKYQDNPISIMYNHAATHKNTVLPSTLNVHVDDAEYNEVRTTG